MIIQLRNKFILLLILLYVSLRKCQHYSLLSSSITRRLEESLDFAKQCDICSYRNNTSNYNNHEYKEEDLVTVDAFYYIAWPEENWYIATGDWWLGPSLVDFFTNKHVNGKGRNETKVLVRIHILTYDDNTLIRGRSVGPPYYAYNLSDYQALYDVFHAMYIPNHMSLNTYHYEFLCFYRWIVYSEIVRNWNIANPNDPITRIITMDSDILFMKNVAELFHNVLNSITFIPGKKKEDFELTVLGLGAIHMWSPVGLHKYSDFIYDWYNDSKIDVKENIKSVLGKSKLNGEYHFSDMQLVEVFIKRDGKTRDSCFLHASSLQSNTNDVHSRYRHCLIDYLKCFPLINYSERGNRLITFNKTTMSLKGSHSDYPYCAMVRNTMNQPINTYLTNN